MYGVGLQAPEKHWVLGLTWDAGSSPLLDHILECIHGRYRHTIGWDP